MSRPRPVPKMRMIRIDRRINLRMFLIRPDADRRSQRLFLFLLGFYLRKFGMILHNVIQMSDHYHLFVTDVFGLAPHFFRDFHAMLARVFMVERDWRDPPWEKKQTAVNEPVTVQGVLHHIAYIVNNGVAAGIVEDPRDFPGAIILPEQIGRLSLTIPRPEHPLLKEGFPKSVTLTPEIPQCLIDAYGEAGARRAIVEACDALTAEIVEERKAQGLGFIGADAMCKVPVTYMAPNNDEMGPAPWFTGGPDGRLAVERAKAARFAWLAAYRSCWKRWQAGELDLVWPADTWKMHVEHKRPRLDTS